jgi:hypothetical protein
MEICTNLCLYICTCIYYLNTDNNKSGKWETKFTNWRGYIQREGSMPSTTG